VWKDNERALRHAVLFAPDFLSFCLRLALQPPESAESAKRMCLFVFEVMNRVTLFALDEKYRLEQWVEVFKSLLDACDDQTQVCLVFLSHFLLLLTRFLLLPLVKDVTDEILSRASVEAWIDSYIFNCPDSSSNRYSFPSRFFSTWTQDVRRINHLL